MLCPKCKKSNYDHAEFCEYCGLELHPQELKKMGVHRRDLMFTKPVYFFSWIALIGLSILRLIIWLIPFIGSPLEFLLLIQIFCGIISANIAKRKGKSALLWFFIGLIPIGISFLFALQILCFIIFPIITGGEL